MRDSGTGMDPDTLARVGEPFFTTKGAGVGTGLGLAMIYGSVEQSGGSIQIESTPGAGTVVHLLFPLAGGADATAPEQSTPEELDAARGARGRRACVPSRCSWSRTRIRCAGSSSGSSCARATT